MNLWHCCRPKLIQGIERLDGWSTWAVLCPWLWSVEEMYAERSTPKVVLPVLNIVLPSPLFTFLTWVKGCSWSHRAGCDTFLWTICVYNAEVLSHGWHVSETPESWSSFVWRNYDSCASITRFTVQVLGSVHLQLSIACGWLICLVLWVSFR